MQKNADTIQANVQKALEKVLSYRPNVTGCSRTDAGVHANMFCCHFNSDTDISVDKLPVALNAHLPQDIRVLKCEHVNNDFHSRYSCKAKNYIYKIYNSNIDSPFLYKYSLKYSKKIDIALLDKEAKDFIGTYDFSAFCASKSSIEDKTRTVKEFDVFEKDDIIIFSVTADGFLYNMVRIMVGTLLAINENKIQKGTIKDIIKSKQRNNAGKTAPAHALYLNKVYY
ncbi:MAG: tRNA pseudouridine(38-40) synthase TruA [Acutalibacteraceae bacterium]|nr:tRNA pseudouridine(38-40) synthase TruA [Acutalibacteraceae bacterium]